ncbi:flagellar hook-basal body complex protein, partial [Caminibacter sp.]
MMRSLWSGVSGLNAHQVAMDVEANNIANVNTVGFKYSRTNFQDLLYQTLKSPTAPQGNLGGKNSFQVGLGTTVSAVETIFKQGSIQNTDKNTDMAISGDGFFVVSEDGGQTYKYTRAGDFTFDANGNFVDPNGYIVQGWLSNPDTNEIDSTTPIKPIKIPPGLTTPAQATSKIQLKANLNSGDHITEKAPTRATVDLLQDINSLYDAEGKQISLDPDNDKLVLNIKNIANQSYSITLKYGKSSNDHDKNFQNLKELLEEINFAITHDSAGVKYYDSISTRRSEYSVYLNGDGQITDPQNRISVDSTSTNNLLTNILSKLNGTPTNSDSIKSIRNSFIGADDVGELFNSNGDAINLQDGEGIEASIEGLGENRKFVYTSEPISNAGTCGATSATYQKDGDITK